MEGVGEAPPKDLENAIIRHRKDSNHLYFESTTAICTQSLFCFVSATTATLLKGIPLHAITYFCAGCRVRI